MPRISLMARAAAMLAGYWLGSARPAAAQANPNPGARPSTVAPVQPTFNLRSPRSFRDGAAASETAPAGSALKRRPKTPKPRS